MHILLLHELFERFSDRVNKHYEYCNSNDHVKVKIPTEKEKWLKFHDGQYELKVPFMLYTDIYAV